MRSAKPTLERPSSPGMSLPPFHTRAACTNPYESAWPEARVRATAAHAAASVELLMVVSRVSDRGRFGGGAAGRVRPDGPDDPPQGVRRARDVVVVGVEGEAEAATCRRGQGEGVGGARTGEDTTE